MKIESPQPFVIEPQAPEFIDFADERLELGYDYGVVGGPEFKTEVIEVADGREQRNILRHLPLGRWQLGQRSIAESEICKLQEVSYLKKFHEDRKGAKQGFRFKDWSDYRAVGQLIAIGNGVTTQWQMRKSYHAGSAITYRPIQRTVEGTVDIYVDGVNVAVDLNHQWEMNHDTGILSHPTPLADGAILTANFEFDVPVWFESDQISFELDYYNPETDEQMYKLGNVFVVEQRLPFLLPWSIDTSADIDEELNLGIVYQTYEKFEYATRKIALASGYTRRESTRDEKRIYFDYGNRTFDQSELNVLLGYFWNARGKAGEFTIVDKGDQYIVRFNADKLNIKFEAWQNDNALLKVSGLKLQLKEKVIYKLPPFSIAAEPIFVDPNLAQSNDSVILASNPSSGSGGGGSGGGGGASGSVASSTAGEVNSSYSLQSFSVGNATFSNSPIAVSITNIRNLIYGAGTLHLFISAPSHPSGIFYMYRLNTSNGWNFIYRASAITNYQFSSLNKIYPFKIPAGVALIGRAYYPLPAPAFNSSNGVLIFVINDNGTTKDYFVPDTASTSGNVGEPVNLIKNRLYLHSPFVSANEMEFIGNFGSLEVYAGQVNRPSDTYPFNKDKTISGEQIPGSGIMNATPGSQHNDNKARIVVDGESVYEYFADSPSRVATLLKETWGLDGSHVVFSKTENLCINEQLGCSTEFKKSFYQIWHKPSWIEQYQLIEDFEALPASNDATYKFQLSFAERGSRYRCDKNGNICQFIASTSVGQPLLYYHRQAGHALDLKQILNFSNLSILTVADSPFGFVILCRNSSSNSLFIYIVKSN
ncbi:MAG: DUF2460 domain-containing protein [Cyanobacteria bacterium P01_A01_bin.40]